MLKKEKRKDLSKKAFTHNNYLSTIEQSWSWTTLASIRSPFIGKQLNQAGITCQTIQQLFIYEEIIAKKCKKLVSFWVQIHNISQQQE